MTRSILSIYLSLLSDELTLWLNSSLFSCCNRIISCDIAFLQIAKQNAMVRKFLRKSLINDEMEANTLQADWEERGKCCFHITTLVMLAFDTKKCVYAALISISAFQDLLPFTCFSRTGVNSNFLNCSENFAMARLPPLEHRRVNL